MQIFVGKSFLIRLEYFDFKCVIKLFVICIHVRKYVSRNLGMYPHRQANEFYKYFAAMFKSWIRNQLYDHILTQVFNDKA